MYAATSLVSTHQQLVSSEMTAGYQQTVPAGQSTPKDDDNNSEYNEVKVVPDEQEHNVGVTEVARTITNNGPSSSSQDTGNEMPIMIQRRSLTPDVNDEAQFSMAADMEMDGESSQQRLLKRETSPVCSDIACKRLKTVGSTDISLANMVLDDSPSSLYIPLATNAAAMFIYLDAMQLKMLQILNDTNEISSNELATRMGYHSKKEINPSLYGLQRKQLVVKKHEIPPIWAITDLGRDQIRVQEHDVATESRRSDKISDTETKKWPFLVSQNSPVAIQASSTISPGLVPSTTGQGSALSTTGQWSLSPTISQELSSEFHGFTKSFGNMAGVKMESSFQQSNLPSLSSSCTSLRLGRAKDLLSFQPPPSPATLLQMRARGMPSTLTTQPKLTSATAMSTTSPASSSVSSFAAQTNQHVNEVIGQSNVNPSQPSFCRQHSINKNIAMTSILACKSLAASNKTDSQSQPLSSHIILPRPQSLDDRLVNVPVNFSLFSAAKSEPADNPLTTKSSKLFDTGELQEIEVGHNIPPTPRELTNFTNKAPHILSTQKTESSDSAQAALFKALAKPAMSNPTESQLSANESTANIQNFSLAESTKQSYSPMESSNQMPASMSLNNVQCVTSETFAALNKNPVSALMEWAQSRKMQATIDVISHAGPSHRPT